jgi:hypothetical protein
MICTRIGHTGCKEPIVSLGALTCGFARAREPFKTLRCHVPKQSKGHATYAIYSELWTALDLENVRKELLNCNAV